MTLGRPVVIEKCREEGDWLDVLEGRLPSCLQSWRLREQGLDLQPSSISLPLIITLHGALA